MHQFGIILPMPTAHIRMHSEYSVSDGVARLSGDSVIAKAAELDIFALGITDVGNMFGAVKFHQSCRKHGIKPVIGCEVPILNGSSKSHMLLYCMNYDGYKNLNKFITKAYTDNNGFVNPEWILSSNEGLIALSGGYRGEIGKLLMNGNTDRAAVLATKFKDAFGDRFYVETWKMNQDDVAHYASCAMAKECDIPIVATHPVQCTNASDLETLEMRRCIAYSKRLKDNDNEPFFADDPYLLSNEEMTKRFSDIPQALENTMIVSQRCAFKYELEKTHLPVISDSEKETSANMLVRLSHENLKQLIPKGMEEKYTSRLNEELEIINRMNYADYYLIVSDFVQWSKKNKIPVGPGRGSGSASLVAYAMNITELDPIKYGLIFERFLNPERVSLPDFDIDFCIDGREKVIKYVTDKYGKDRVSQIVTFGQIAARGSVRDAGRVMSYPYSVCDRVARAIPGLPDMTIARALKESQELRDAMESSEEVKTLIEAAKMIEGLPRNIGTHAGGVLISPEPITNFCPLYKDSDNDNPVSQMDMNDVEKIGLVKFDFLGLKTLTILNRAETMLKEQSLVDDRFSFDNIPLNDPTVYQMYSDGDLKGVFQCESSGMQDMMKRVKPDKLADIVALIALYRPGPMQFMDTFINRKHGKEEINYPHDSLKKLLEETYGVWVYQEQVMETARIISGYSLGEADILRRAMGKKKPEEMAQQRERFVSGAKENVPKETAEKVFDQLSEFAEYGFNKAHAAAYALISYRTAYCKTHYPAAFYAATMSVNNGEKDFKELAEAARKQNIKLLNPDINTSGKDFALTKNNEVRFGLATIKNVGASFIDNMVKVRGNKPFSDIFDFCKRMNKQKQMHRGAVENLINAGAFDSVCENRAAVYETLPSASNETGEKGSGLFGDDANNMVKAKPWSFRKTLENEQKSIGFPISGSFYEIQKPLIESIPKCEFSNIYNQEQFTIVGLVSKIIEIKALKKYDMKILRLEDYKSEHVEFAVTGKMLNDMKDKIKEGQDVIVVQGYINNKNKIKANAVQEISEYVRNNALKIKLRCNDNDGVKRIYEILRNHTPDTDKNAKKINLEIKCMQQNNEVIISFDDKFPVSAKLCEELMNVDFNENQKNKLIQKCNIAIMQKDGTVLSIPCDKENTDDVKHNLLEYYNTPEKISELLELGYLGSFDNREKIIEYDTDWKEEKIQIQEYENMTKYLNRREMNKELLYLWNGEWMFQEVCSNEKVSENSFKSLNADVSYVSKSFKIDNARSILNDFLNSNMPDKYRSKILSAHDLICGTDHDISYDKCEKAKTALDSLVNKKHKKEISKYFSLEQIKAIKSASKLIAEYQESNNEKNNQDQGR